MKVQRNMTLTELGNLQRKSKSKKKLMSSSKKLKQINQASIVTNSKNHTNLYLSKNSFQKQNVEQQFSQSKFKKKMMSNALLNIQARNFDKKSTIKKAKHNNENYDISQTEKKVRKKTYKQNLSSQKKVLKPRLVDNQGHQFLTSVDKMKQKHEELYQSINTSYSRSRNLEQFITEEVKNTLKTLGYVEGLNHSLFSKINLILRTNGFKDIQIDQNNLIENLGKFNFKLDEYLFKNNFKNQKFRQIQNFNNIFKQHKNLQDKTKNQSQNESIKIKKLLKIVDKLKMQANDSLSQLSSSMSQTEYNLIKDCTESPLQSQEESYAIKQLHNTNCENISNMNSKLSSDISSFNCYKSENSGSFFSNNRQLKDLLQDVTFLKRKLKSIEQFMSYENDQKITGHKQLNSHDLQFSYQKFIYKVQVNLQLMKQNNSKEKLSALSEELSQNFENVSDVDDEQLKNEILNSKSEFVQVPEVLPCKSQQLDRNANQFMNQVQQNIFKPIEFSNKKDGVLKNFQPQNMAYSNLKLSRFIHKNQQNPQKEENLINHYQKLLDDENQEKKTLRDKNKQLNEQLQQLIEKQHLNDNEIYQKVYQLENQIQRLEFEKANLQQQIEQQQNQNSFIFNEEIQRKELLLNELQTQISQLKLRNNQQEEKLAQNQDTIMNQQATLQELNSNTIITCQKQELTIKNIQEQLEAYKHQNQQLKQQLEQLYKQNQQVQGQFNQMQIENFQLKTQLDYQTKVNYNQTNLMQNYQNPNNQYASQQILNKFQAPYLEEIQPIANSQFTSKIEENSIKQLKPINFNLEDKNKFSHRNIQRQRHFQTDQKKEDLKQNLMSPNQEQIDFKVKIEQFDDQDTKPIPKKFPTQVEQLENEIYEICEKRRVLNKQYHKLQHSRLKSGIMIRKKQQVEQDLLEINKEIATKKNQLRLLKLN